MRYYKLTIKDGDTKQNILEVDSRSLWAGALNVGFNLSIYEDTQVQSTGYIRVYGLNTAWYSTNLKKLLPQTLGSETKARATITLECGFVDSPLTTMYRASSKFHEGIMVNNSYIYNIAGEFSGADQYIDFYIGQIDSEGNETSKLQTSSITIQVNNGEDFGKKLVDELVKANFNEGMIELSNNYVTTDKTINTTGSDITFSGKSINSIVQQVCTAGYLRVKYIAGKMVVSNDYREDDVARLAERVKDTAEALVAQASSSFNLGLSNMLVVTPHNLLAQPVYNTVNELSVTVPLSPTLKLGDMVLIKGATPSGITDLNNNATYDNSILFQSGVFKITKLNHVGEFSNTSPASWSTQMVVALQGRTNV